MLKPEILNTCRPCFTEADYRAVSRVLDSGYIGMGPEVAAFEKELGQYLGMDAGTGGGVACVHTGTSALHLAVASLELDAGDEVLIPSLTYVASFQAVAVTGAIPIACDVNPVNGLLDLEDCANRLTKRTRAIMPVHYAGNLGDLTLIYKFAADHGLRVIEDAAHAFGSHFEGAPAGSMGDLVCLSFDPIKNITAGEGGAIVCRDEQTLQKLRELRNLGIQPLDTSDGSYDFDVSSPGYRYHMPDLMAAIGRSQLARFTSDIVPAKKEIKAAYTECLAGIDGITMLPLEDECLPHIVPIMVDPQKRPTVQQKLADAGFETKIHYKPNHLLSAWAGSEPCPNAEYVYARVLTLPSHLGVSRTHIESIAEILAHC